MQRIAWVVAVAAVASVVGSTATTSGSADNEAAPIFGVRIPPGYQRLATNLSDPRRRRLQPVASPARQRYSVKGLSRRQASVS